MMFTYINSGVNQGGTMYFVEKALEYIFLPVCGICGKLGEGYLCKDCKKNMNEYCIKEKSYKIVVDLKDKIDKANKNIIQIINLLKYEGLVRKLLIDYKFNDKSYLYKTFCEIIKNDKKTLDFIKSYDIIIPVPIHKKRMKKRGYNQSELIARELAKICGNKVYTNILIKIKNNKAQSTLNKEERENNAKNVYKLNKPEKIKNKNVLILDDIYTTGATVKECALELGKANIKEIGVFTVAKD